MTYILIFLLQIAVLAFMGAHIYYQRKLGTPTVPGATLTIQKMIGRIPPETTGEILELGSGWGGMAMAAATAFPACKVTGIEYAPLPFLVSRLQKKRRPELKNLAFVRKDFFDVSFRDTQVVLCYLLVPTLEKLKKKFQDELPAGALVISNSFAVPGWEPEDIIAVDTLFDKKIYVYKIRR